MCKSSALKNFNNNVAYEKYYILNVIEQCNKYNLYFYSQQGLLKFINHTPLKSIEMHIEDSMGPYDKIKTYIYMNTMPLIFISSFKIIDMFMEYMIETNEEESPRGFKEKIDKIKKLDIKHYPVGIDSSSFSNIFKIYKNLRECRNKIIHKDFGRVDVNQEKLILKDRMELSFEEIFALSSIAYSIWYMLNITTYKNESISMYKNSIYYSLNKLKKYTNLDKEYDCKLWQHWNIEYIINLPESEFYIDIKNIENEIECYIKEEQTMYDNLNPKYSPNRGERDHMYEYAYWYTVTVKTEDTKWVINSEQLKEFITKDNKVNLSDIKEYSIMY